MRFIEGLHCVVGNEWAVELALREALGNAVIHGNEMDPHKFVQLRRRCELGKGVWLTVKDQGKGFEPTAVPDPVVVERLEEEHGRGIHLMKLAWTKSPLNVEGASLKGILNPNSIRVRARAAASCSQVSTKPGASSLHHAHPSQLPVSRHPRGILEIAALDMCRGPRVEFCCTN